MVRSLLLTIAMLFCLGAAIAQSTVLTGKVSDDKGEALIGASVKVSKGTDMIKGAVTDYEGNFRISLDPGTYTVEFTYTGFNSVRVEGVKVLTAQLNFLNQAMSDNLTLSTVDIVAYKVPLIEQDKTSGGQTLTSDQIKNLPTRSVNAIVATTAGTTSIDGGAINIKGARSTGTNYYIDGIRVSGSPPPVQDLEQLQVITGGLGAEYGDVTGGVISMVTKGPASEYHGAVEVENSNGLDQYGWLLATANVSGPIIKKKQADGSSRTLLGFRMSGQYNTQKDDDPPATPVYLAKGQGIDMAKLYSTDDAIANAERAKLNDPNNVLGRLMAQPIVRSGELIIPYGETLTNDSVDTYHYNPYENRRDIDLTGKLDLRLTNNIDFSVTGTYKDQQDQFTPDRWRLVNTQFNPTQYSSRYRGIGRFRHRLGNNDNDDNSSSSNRVSISNASYQLQFAFERGNAKVYDPRHEDRLFDYGYVGKFEFENIPQALAFRDPITGETTVRHAGYTTDFIGFTQSTINAGLLPYNEFADPERYETYQATNGIEPNLYTTIWGNHSNAGLVYNSFSNSQDDIMTITANSSFDLKLGKTGVHNIQFGLLNEQRTSRFRGVAPIGLWQQVIQSANSHFNGIDLNAAPIGTFVDPDFADIGELPLYPYLVVDQPGRRFYRAIRESLGVPINQYLNVEALDPSQLSLNMFSPRELTDRGLVNYYGYDYLGNLTSEGVSFNDFFRLKDADGARSLPVAPLRPLYQAAFLKDKFTFNKMIFSLGVRVERFDLNTKVMKDQYSLYDIMTAKDYFASVPGAPSVRPGNVGDDFKVYTASEQDNSPVAFRNGDTWYFPDGRQANDGVAIYGSGGVVHPLLVNDTEITSDDFDPNSSFVDYTPQVNWLPRLGFSFPISEDANFFAHYDVLVQRPTNYQVTALDYFYFYTPGRTPANNANLKPEKVVDYEVGFQQRLNQNSALKFSAYYREMRDMTQSRTIQQVPEIGLYTTYGNIDFGTVKGFTVQYDLRRINNAELRLAYTLQFADGTGSNANSQRGLTRLGNIRNLYPLDFDERHNLSGILDYRFSEGRDYNGPRIGNSDILSNFGANLQLTAVSGRPYTSNIRATQFGGTGIQGAINGNRLPWRFTLDLRVDKSFSLTAKNKKPLNLNVYFRVSNLLNRKNVQAVYPVTGSPTDDGYLATAEGVNVINNVVTTGRSTQAYLNSYSWLVRNPDFYMLPRRMYVGAAFEF
ncbi:MAG: carboxypeptidase regulatory-like domain-containing protein [Saprospiraceae bacterium]|nr:carboxypeptidase regulatory-like domain-containing protein [Saprospiraceae bacterium]